MVKIRWLFGVGGSQGVVAAVRMSESGARKTECMSRSTTNGSVDYLKGAGTEEDPVCRDNTDIGCLLWQYGGNCSDLRPNERSSTIVTTNLPFSWIIELFEKYRDGLVLS